MPCRLRARARSPAQQPELAPEVTIFRALDHIRPEDQFFNRFAAMAQISPLLRLIGGGQTRFQPVFVGNVAHAITKAAAGDTKPGTTYELGGPDVRTFKEATAAGADPIRARRITGIRPPVSAHTAAHAGPSRAAQARQCRLCRR